MKIEGEPLGHIQTDATDRTSRATGDSTAGAAPAAPGPSTDQLKLSSDAQLLSAAVKAATSAPASDPKSVDRLRALLKDGQIGNDPHKLADAIINSLLGS